MVAYFIFKSCPAIMKKKEGMMMKKQISRNTLQIIAMIAMLIDRFGGPHDVCHRGGHRRRGGQK